MSSPTVPIQFVHRALHTVARSGVDVNALLRGTGVSPDLVVNPRARVTVEQVTVLTQRLWQLTGDELFGAGEQPVPRGTFRLLSLALIHSPDLHTALRRFDEFTDVMPNVPSLTVTTGPDSTRLRLDVDVLDDPEHLVIDLTLAVCHRFTSWLIGKRIKLSSVELPYSAPPEAADYDRVFGTMPTFDSAGAALSFDSALLAAPVVRTEQDLVDYLNNSPGDLLSRRDYGSTMADQVRRILEYALNATTAGAATTRAPVPPPWPTPEEVAMRLVLSVQHLRRKLREEGTSMSQIREEILRDAAIASLARGQEPVTELAARLGFSEPSAFRRAFRRWTGSPPGSYRPERPAEG
jgi:AraC-like DNA-binding protein